MLPTDIALKTDPSFSVTARLYADDESVFFSDFSLAYSKLLSLGCESAPPACPHAREAFSAEFRDHSMHGSIEHCRAAVEKGADVHSREKVSVGGRRIWAKTFFNFLALRNKLTRLFLSPQNSGRTALHKACYWNHTHMMSWMLTGLKLDPNVQDYNGDTALHDASMFGHVKIVEALLEAGCDRSIKNKSGKTAAEVAVDYEKPETAAILKGKGGVELPVV
jgi:hypothetical protein